MNGLYDCHTHSYCSHDSKSDPVESIKIAKKNGLSGIAITDHCDIEYYYDIDTKTPIEKSVKLAESLAADALSGIEVGEAIWHLKEATETVESKNFDIVIGSVHAVRYKELTIPFSQIDFSAVKKDEIYEYLDAYFDDISEMIYTFDFDVLAHLTVPLRYICGKYGFEIELDRFSEKIDGILKEIIARNIALEVNTSCLDSNYNELLPNLSIIKRYKELGGYLVTLGSDAHKTERVGYRFNYVKEKLKELGFTDVYYYKNRNAISVRI